MERGSGRRTSETSRDWRAPSRTRTSRNCPGWAVPTGGTGIRSERRGAGALALEGSILGPHLEASIPDAAFPAWPESRPA